MSLPTIKSPDSFIFLFNSLQTTGFFLQKHLGLVSAMKSAILNRSGSLQALTLLRIGSGSDTAPLRRSRSIVSMSPRSALHVDIKTSGEAATIRRARSDTDLLVSDHPSRIWSAPVGVVVVEEEEEEAEFSGGGRGRGIKIGGGEGGDGGDSNENKRIENYYREKLRSDPSNPLLLRNYGKFLHEVEGDLKGAEECYSRAILASPKDGDVLSLYGKLVWETHRDEERAGGYFERAVEASPDDCYVLGSYASFLWEAEEEEEATAATTAASMIEAF